MFEEIILVSLFLFVICGLVYCLDLHIFLDIKKWDLTSWGIDEGISLDIELNIREHESTNKK